MLALLDAFILLMGAAFIMYVAMIVVPFVRRKPRPPGDVDDYTWHIFVPCLNEAAVIEDTILRARTKFPTAHLWVIDDDSDDLTASIAESHGESDEFVHVVRRIRPEARTGKGHALNAAFARLNAWLPAATDRERLIVVVVDADGDLAENAFSAVAGDGVFGDPGIGAAQISVWMRNRDDPRPHPGKGRVVNALGRVVVRMQDLEFRTVIEAMQALRSRTGTVGLGGNGQFTRLSTLDRIADKYGEPWHGALLEDYELGVHVALIGYRVAQVRETHVSQEGLPSIRRLFRQRTRWAQGNMQCAGYIPQIIRNPHFDSAGVLESCYYLLLPFLQLACLCAMVVVLAVNVTVALMHPEMMQVRAENLPLAFGIILLFAIGPFVFWGPVYRKYCEPRISLARSIFYGLCLAVYNLHVVAVQAPALVRIVLRRTSWAKTKRNAEGSTVRQNTDLSTGPSS